MLPQNGRRFLQRDGHSASMIGLRGPEPSMVWKRGWQLINKLQQPMLFALDTGSQGLHFYRSHGRKATRDVEILFEDLV